MALKIPGIPNLLFTQSRADDQGIAATETQEIFYLTIPASSWKPNHPDSEVVDYGFDDSSQYMRNESGGTLDIGCPVILPHNAIVLSVKVIGDSGAVAWRLERGKITSGDSDVSMASAPVGSEDSSIINATIDNENYYYNLIIENYPNGNYIYGSVIKYQTSRVNQ